MNKILFLLTTAIFFTLSANAQRFFFIGEKSYPCTETIALQSNHDGRSNLDVALAKDGTTGVIIVSTKTASTVLIREKLFIYLDDGTVISCIDRGNNDQVDFISTTVYYLTDGDLIKMKKSNINTLKYTLRSETDMWSNKLSGGNYSASNNGSNSTDFPALISKFFIK